MFAPHNPHEYMDYYSFNDPGRDGRLSWLDPQRTVDPQNGHLSTTDCAQGRESPPA